MKKAAFVFPGQGSQQVGMGKALCGSSKAAKAVYDEASKALGYDMASLSFEGPQEELDRTEKTQPALLTASVAALCAFGEAAGPGVARPAFYAGHSLGEYTALVASGSLAFTDAVRLVQKRGVFMQESVPADTGLMCAVLGLDVKTVEELCAAASTVESTVVAANINSPEQVVVSGHKEAVERAAVLAKERGAKRAIILQVSAPSHCPLMAPAAARLKAELEGATFGALAVPVVANVTARSVEHPSEVRGLLERQLTNPVRWVETVQVLKASGVTHVVEVGPGKVLSGLVKRIDKELVTLNLGTPEDMDGVLAALS